MIRSNRLDRRERAWILLFIGLASSTLIAEAAENGRIGIDELTALLPGAPPAMLGEAEYRPLALLLWPADAEREKASSVTAGIAAIYSKIGAGALFLSLNGPAAGGISATPIPPKSLKALIRRAGKEAKRDWRHTDGSPLALLRRPDGTFESRGPLDLEHGGYNLVRGLKEALDVKFESLEPLDVVALTDLDGRAVKLSQFLSDLDTDVALVDIWGTWCPPCQQSLPHLVRLSEAHLGKVTVVGITCEAEEALEERLRTLEAFQEARKIRIPYPLLMGDVWQMRLEVPVFLGYPTLLIVRREGGTSKLLWQHTGFEPGDDAKIEAALENALR